MTTPDLTQHASTLADGRHLFYRVVGDPDGSPVLYHHGGLSSSLDIVGADAAARARGLRLVAPNRRGWAGRPRQPGRIMADWPADAVELADRLGLGSFGVLGWSLGGGFAQAVAAQAADRTSRLILVASTIPPTWAGMTSEINRTDRLLMALHQRTPKVDRALVRGLRLVAHRAPRAMARAAHLPAVASDQVIAAITEGLHQAAGVLDEYHTMGVPWGFEPSSITVATEVWQGDHDDLVPAGWGARLTEAIPDATRHEVAGGTHFLALDRWDEILDGFVPPT